jgi:hypothetical protein
LIRNAPFAEDADDPFVPFIDHITSNEIMSDDDQFFPTNPHPFRTGTIIEENGFLFKGREMDGLIFYDSLQVLDDPSKTLDIINESDQYWTTCSSAPPIAPSIAHIMDSGRILPAIDVDVKSNLISVLKTRRILRGKVQENFLSNISNILPPTTEPTNTLHIH